MYVLGVQSTGSRHGPDTVDGSRRLAYDNAVVEAFWGRLQVELLNRRRWKTRIELATSIHDWIESFYNPRRRHSSLAMRSSVEYELAYTTNLINNDKAV
ncbi:MAG: integrase core domain-containing protein [Solirubrobacteraceae bacterium]